MDHLVDETPQWSFEVNMNVSLQTHINFYLFAQIWFTELTQFTKDCDKIKWKKNLLLKLHVNMDDVTLTLTDTIHVYRSSCRSWEPGRAGSLREYIEVAAPPPLPPPDIPRWWCRAPVVTTWGHHLTQPLSVSRVIQQPTCCAVKTIDQTLILYWSYHHTGLTTDLTCN